MKYLKLTILILFSEVLLAQSLNCTWLHSCGDDYDEYSSDSECDNDGNFIISGAFSGQLALDYFDSTYYLENLGSRKAFLAKYSPAHELIWATNFGGASDTYVKQIRVLHDNSILICGKYIGDCDFLPGPEEYIIEAYGGADAFFAHYSSDGELLWAIGLGGPNGNDWGTSINSDADGNIYIGGYFNIYADIDPGPEEFLVYNPLGAESDMFIAKLNPSGEFLWGGSVNGPSLEIPTDFAFDEDGNLVVSGLYEFQPDFDLFEGEWVADAIPNGTYENAYIAKYSPDGNLISFKAWGNSGYDSVTWMSKNDQGYLIAGMYGSGNDLDPTDSVMQWPFADSRDMYVAQLDNELNFLWTYTAGGENDDVIFDLDTDDFGNIAFTGEFRDEIDIDPGAIEYILEDPIPNNAEEKKTMLVILDKDGNFKEGQQMNGTDWNYGHGIGVNDDQIMILGGFNEWAFSGNCEAFGETDLSNYDIYMIEFNSTFLGVSNQEQSRETFTAFPNPTDKNITISVDRKLQSPNAKLELKTTDGRSVFETQLSTAKTQYNIPTSELAEGVYLLVLEGENFSTVQRVVVMH
jgi:hypothetical protein